LFDLKILYQRTSALNFFNNFSACPDCASKPFSDWDLNVVKKRGGYRPSAGRPTALGQGQTTTIRIPQKYKEQVMNYVKTLAKMETGKSEKSDGAGIS